MRLIGLRSRAASGWPGVWRTTKDFYTEIRTGNEDPFEFLAGNISIMISKREFWGGGRGRGGFRSATVGNHSDRAGPTSRAINTRLVHGAFPALEELHAPYIPRLGPCNPEAFGRSIGVENACWSKYKIQVSILESSKVSKARFPPVRIRRCVNPVLIPSAFLSALPCQPVGPARLSQ